MIAGDYRFHPGTRASSGERATDGRTAENPLTRLSAGLDVEYATSDRIGLFFIFFLITL